MIKTLIVFCMTLLSLASCIPILVEDEEGHQYYLSPIEESILSRHRREEPKLPGPNDPKAFAEYNANKHSQGGKFVYQKPDGSGFSIGHGHANGMGHTWSVDGKVPVYSGKNALGDYSFNLGAGTTQHYGGWPGNMNMDKRIHGGFVQRF
ncbi:uncharacterized protein LOC126743021 [Anthonomus grandis grandis]|uniref:uncharacterized protein LOC126743021 n=1 Tax=Anthonomus grandis grandis TaxID=2921223 RepID=UPI002164F89A|nr:uncharacterized protein LOC126743021 [Anthonomus grandis grandis]